MNRVGGGDFRAQLVRECRLRSVAREERAGGQRRRGSAGDCVLVYRFEPSRRFGYLAFAKARVGVKLREVREERLDGGELVGLREGAEGALELVAEVLREDRGEVCVGEWRYRSLQWVQPRDRVGDVACYESLVDSFGEVAGHVVRVRDEAVISANSLASNGPAERRSYQIRRPSP